MTQVITVAPDGSISGLQVKPGKGLDLRQFGPAEINRASEIKWHAEHQKWYVECTRGRHCGRVLTPFAWTFVNKGRATGTGADFAGPMLFDEYDEAVAAEIKWLDHIRLTEGPHALRPDHAHREFEYHNQT